MVAQYLDDLPKDQLDLLKMNFFEEKSHGEIAEITKILRHCKSRIRLALEKIRGKLEQDGTMVNLNNDREVWLNKMTLKSLVPVNSPAILSSSSV